jgi:anti-sigma factor ChrR (cupin superfamily)
MLDINLRQVISSGSSEFKPYDRYGEPIPGMSWIPLSGKMLNGEFESFLLRMDAGSRSRPHEHMGMEEFLMIDGDLIDCDGTMFRKGDFVSFEAGSKHSSHTPNGCTLLVMLRGNNRSLSDAELQVSSA